MQEQKYAQESVSIFYSYAREDEKLRKQLETHLSLLRQQGLITEWHDRQIDAGVDWKQAIDTHLMNASIILLLISPDFIASDYCYGIEMQQALEHHQRNKARVIPILLRPTDWEDAPFADLQYLPHNGRPVTMWHNRDKAFVEIAKSIRSIVTGVDSPSAASPYLSAPLTLSLSSLPQQEASLKSAALSSTQNEPTVIAYQLAHRGRSLSFFAWLVNLLAIAVLSVVLNFIPSLEFIPFISYMQQHQFAFLNLACGAVLLTLIGSLILWRLASHKHYPPLHRQLHSWRLIASTSTLSFILCFSLLMTVLLQPSWCPGTLCSPPIAVSTAGTHPQGVRDTNLEAYFLTFESNAFVIPGDPAHTPPGAAFNETNPHAISAAPTESSLSSSDYRIVLMVHSLYQGRYSILIDQVALTVIDRPIMPQPLNVWVNKSLVYYDTSRYGIVYDGEGPDTVLPAKYLASPYGYTQLAHNEADQLNIQISSPIPVDLKFQIQVTYHIATEAKKSLQLPEVFEVVFSDQSNWHPYQIQSSHFVPA